MHFIQKIFLKQKIKGSILAYSLIILAMMFAIAGSMTAVSIIEKRDSGTGQFSAQSFQVADNSAQLAIREIDKELKLSMDSKLSDVFSCESNGSVKKNLGTGMEYTLSFFKEGEITPISDCNEKLINVANIKSVGTFKNTVRAVRVAVDFKGVECKDITCGSTQTCTHDGVEYGTVLAKDGSCWLDRNLGASRVANAYNDSQAYGWYYQWGRNMDGHQDPTKSPGNITTLVRSNTDTPVNGKFIINSCDWRITDNNLLWGATGINNPCPSGYRVPGRDDWQNMQRDENIIDYNSAFNSTLKLPLSGRRSRSNNGELEDFGGNGWYWTNFPHCFWDVPSMCVLALNFHISLISAQADSPACRAEGHSVRCIKD